MHLYFGRPTSRLTASSSVGAVILKITYGDQVQRKYGRELVELNTKAMSYALWSTAQIWLVDMFPLGLAFPSEMHAPNPNLFV